MRLVSDPRYLGRCGLRFANRLAHVQRQCRAPLSAQHSTTVPDACNAEVAIIRAVDANQCRECRGPSNGAGVALQKLHIELNERLTEVDLGWSLFAGRLREHRQQ